MFTSLQRLTQLVHTPHIWTAYLVGLALLATLLWRKYRYPRRSHQWRIKAASNVLQQLQFIGRERGPAAQFAYLRRIDPFVFEEAILSAIEAAGHKIERSRRYTGDDGVDGECRIEGQRILLQMKRYAKHVNRQHVIAFATLCREQRAQGMFVHTGRTGKGVHAMSDDAVVIVSGARLLRCLGVDGSTKADAWRSAVCRRA